MVKNMLPYQVMKRRICYYGCKKFAYHCMTSLLLLLTVMLHPQSLQTFLMSLSSSSPVCAYIPPNETVVRALGDFMLGTNVQRHPVVWKVFKEQLPTLVDVIVHAASDDEFTVPDELKNLLALLVERAVALFCRDFQMPEISPPSDQNDQLACFPSLPCV